MCFMYHFSSNYFTTPLNFYEFVRVWLKNVTKCASYHLTQSWLMSHNKMFCSYYVYEPHMVKKFYIFYPGGTSSDSSMEAISCVSVNID